MDSLGRWEIALQLASFLTKKIVTPTIRSVTPTCLHIVLSWQSPLFSARASDIFQLLLTTHF